MYMSSFSLYPRGSEKANTVVVLATKEERQIFIQLIVHMAVIYNCEKQQPRKKVLHGHHLRSESKHEEKVKLLKVRSKVAAISLFLPSHPRIYLPNCRYLMFNVFVHLLILAWRIIFTWFMYDWGCVQCFSLFFSRAFWYRLEHNKSNIVFFIIHSHLASRFFSRPLFTPLRFDTCSVCITTTIH